METIVLCNGAYGTGNFGDDAILDGVLSICENKYNVIVVCNQPSKIGKMFNVEATGFDKFPSKYDILAVWGGFVLNRLHIDSLMHIIERELAKDVRLWIRAIGTEPDWNINWNKIHSVFGKAEIFSVRSNYSKNIIRVMAELIPTVEEDPINLCRIATDYEKPPEGIIGMNYNNYVDKRVVDAILTAYRQVDVPVIGIAAMVHSWGNTDEVRILKSHGLDVIYDEDPRKLKASLKHLGLLYSNHKHLAVAAGQFGVPVILFNGLVTSALIHEWKLDIRGII